MDRDSFDRYSERSQEKLSNIFNDYLKAKKKLKKQLKKEKITEEEYKTNKKIIRKEYRTKHKKILDKFNEKRLEYCCSEVKPDEPGYFEATHYPKYYAGI